MNIFYVFTSIDMRRRNMLILFFCHFVGTKMLFKRLFSYDLIIDTIGLIVQSWTFGTVMTPHTVITVIHERWILNGLWKKDKAGLFNIRWPIHNIAIIYYPEGIENICTVILYIWGVEDIFRSSNAGGEVYIFWPSYVVGVVSIFFKFGEARRNSYLRKEVLYICEEISCSFTRDFCVFFFVIFWFCMNGDSVDFRIETRNPPGVLIKTVSVSAGNVY